MQFNPILATIEITGNKKTHPHSTASSSLRFPFGYQKQRIAIGTALNPGLIGSDRAKLHVRTAMLLMITLVNTIQTYLQYYPPADRPKPIDSSHILLP